MKTIFTFFMLIIISFSVQSQVNTKLIASRYGKGVVKIIIVDPELEKLKPGAGYLGRGSGFFVTNDGYIFTNRHVVETCVKGYIDYNYKDQYGTLRIGTNTYSEELIRSDYFVEAIRTGYTVPVIQVFYGENENDYKLYKAEVVSMGDGAFDGALLKIVSDENGNTGAFNFTALPLGDSNGVQQGEQFCVFGYPSQVRGSADVMLRDMSTLSMGIMSGRDVEANQDYGFFKTDAEIHPGNSGGPVFNEQNKVVGIATAKGVTTGIGLVGGVNGMYYVTATDGQTHKKLVSKGLNPPDRASSISTITGNRLPIRSVEEINGNSKGNNKNTSSTSYYNDANIFFSVYSLKANNNILPEKTKRNTWYTIDKKKGGVVWIYVDNKRSPINTNKIRVIVDKSKVGKNSYKKVDDAYYNNVRATDNFTHFSYTFKEKGDYFFSIYAENNKLIGTARVKITYK